MKTPFLIIYFLASNLLLAAGPIPSEPKKNEVNGGIVINESLQKLIDVQGVKPVYETCKANNPSDTDGGRAKRVLDCLWRDLPADIKKKVQEAYTAEIKPQAVTRENRSPASVDPNKLALTGRETNVAVDYETDPAVKALSDFYGKKLDEVLELSAKDQKDGKILAVDHRKFGELYKSELGKTIISAFTSFCLDTDPAERQKGNFVLSGVLKDNRKDNIASIKNAKFEADSADAEQWKKCIASVPKACTSSNSDETTRRSCLIMDYVAAARKNIMIVDKQKVFYDKLASKGGIALNAKAVDEEKNTSDAILGMSSKDVADTLKDPTQKELDALKECYDGNVIVNADACKKYLNTNRNENELAIVELGIRQNVQEEVLKNELNSSTQKITDYLLEEGYTEEQAKALTADQKKIDDIKNEIMDRFKAKKEAIIQEMADKIEKKTASTDGKIDANNRSDVEKIKKIREEIDGRSDDLKNLVSFNNIVSSYLEVSDSATKNVSRNTASLFAEVNSLENAQEKKNYQDNIKAARLEEKKVNADLNVETINNVFLKYKNQKNP